MRKQIGASDPQHLLQQHLYFETRGAGIQMQRRHQERLIVYLYRLKVTEILAHW